MTIHIHYTGLLQVIGLNECEDCTGEVGSLENLFLILFRHKFLKFLQD